MSEGSNKKAKIGESQYDALERVTTIVADTGEIDKMKKFMPTDATTNPSLIFKVILSFQLFEYAFKTSTTSPPSKSHWLLQ